MVAGQPRAIARAMRLVDDRAPEAAALLKALWPSTGKARVIGVTGNPGAGKSTLCDRLIAKYRADGERVGVVAVDPSSPYTGGAILGDRIRMARHATDDGVFIRSLATRGHLGGLSRSARDVVRVLDAAGYGVVLVETVGVGQDELEVTRLADSTLVVMAPGLGDEVQAIKAGLLECADAFAVNKADRDGADAVVRDLELTLALGVAGWVPPIVKCVASRGEGTAAIVTALAAHKAWLDGTEAGRERRRRRLRNEVRESLREALIGAAIADLGPELEDAVRAVEERACDPYTATERLVAAFRAGR
ncbi:MAG TPA: methylmalonyl Co-A mutase-associated GTPase MeaB [Polyangiaceae bacterium]|nr:methylmalonyl Co-A mutase-associated GTPase MeaB [Polyangiaceae bacterium]